MDGNDDDARSGVLTEASVRDARVALADTGLIIDEHSFASYRETVSRNVSAIEAAVNEGGRSVELVPGFVADHPLAGYAYYIYDINRFGDAGEAEMEVRRWLSQWRNRMIHSG